MLVLFRENIEMKNRSDNSTEDKKGKEARKRNRKTERSKV